MRDPSNRPDDEAADEAADARADEGGIEDLPRIPQDPHGNEGADAADAADADAGSPKSSQATRLVELAREAGIELFVDPRGNAYARVPVDQHCEVFAVESAAFTRWLRQRAYSEWQKAPPSQAIADAINNLSAAATYSGNVEEVYVRVAAVDDAILIDLGQPDWSVIRVTKDGWQRLAVSPVPFRRPSGFGALPTPVEGGRLDALRPLVNCTNEDWPLILSWLACSLSGRGSYPILLLTGSHSSAKSTTARMLRAIVDPNTSPYRGEPSSERDFAIGAQNNWVVALDNLSSIKLWLSDALCRLVTGGGFAARKLYSNDEEAVFELKRPAVITAIQSVATRADLRDRTWQIRLPPIQERRSEKELRKQFESVKPGMFGALLDALVTGLRNIDDLEATADVRLVDAAFWSEACRPAFGVGDTSIPDLLAEKRDRAIRDAIDDNPMLVALLEELEEAGEIDGTPAELLKLIRRRAPAGTLSPAEWPQSAKVLSDRLTLAEGDLRAIGVEVTRWRTPDRHRRRLIRLHIETPSAFVRCVRCVRKSTEAPEQHEFTTGNASGRSGNGFVRSASAASDPGDETRDDTATDDDAKAPHEEMRGDGDDE